MKRRAFPMSYADKLNLIMSGAGAGLICHFIKNIVSDTTLLFVFGTLITAMFRYFTAKGVEHALRQRRSLIEGWTRFRLLRLSTRLASIDLFNYPNLADTPNPVLEAVDDAGLIRLAKVQYAIIGIGLVTWGMLYMLRT